MHRNPFLVAVAITLALTACAPDAAERLTGPGARQADEIPVISLPDADTIIIETTSGGNAFGSGN